MGNKICTKCNNEYLATLEFFPPNKQTKDKLGSWCRECHRKLVKKYRQRCSKKIKEYRKTYYNALNGYLREVYYNIQHRCINSKNKSYNRYGGRGIKLEFTYQELLDWCITNNISPHGLTIDRINNNGNYELGNIRFITQSENSKNRSE